MYVCQVAISLILLGVANFGELRKDEVRLCPGPMGEDFSGSWSVTSRHPLIPIGATNATW